MPRKKVKKNFRSLCCQGKPPSKTLRKEGWYHIPVDTAPKRFPPKVMAFYQGRVFGDEAYKIRYFGEVIGVEFGEGKVEMVTMLELHKCNHKTLQEQEVVKRETESTARAIGRLVYELSPEEIASVAGKG